MSKQNDGGSAFPEIKTHYRIDEGFAEVYSDGGISVRDCFALGAMQSIVTAVLPVGDYEEARVAENAYKLADAMLKEREK